MADPADVLELPAWAQVTAARRAHIARVTALLDSWASAIGVGADEADEWHDAGRWHDSLRDAPDGELRFITGDATSPANTLHGPAAAARLEQDGESRPDLLDAIRHHTLGHAGWGSTGRALYMADYLEPGRKFAQADRAFLAAQVPRDFEGVFRQVVRLRIEGAVRDGRALSAETVALWNSLQ